MKIITLCHPYRIKHRNVEKLCLRPLGITVIHELYYGQRSSLSVVNYNERDKYLSRCSFKTDMKTDDCHGGNDKYC